MLETLNLNKYNAGKVKRTIIKRWIRQRSIRGFSDVDVWNLDGFLLKLIPDAIKRLAEISHGWPQSEKFPTFESWEKFLKDLSSDFRRAQSLIYFEDSDESYELLKKCNSGIKSFEEDYVPTIEEKRECGTKLLKDCFNRLSDNITDLWD